VDQSHPTYTAEPQTIQVMKTLLAQLVALLFAAAAAGEELATIRVAADKPGAPVSRSLYGIFFEEVNHAGDGGLYAEMIRNRSFDATLPVEGCTLEGGTCKAVPAPCYSTGRINNWSTPWKFDTPWPAWSLEKPADCAAVMSIETDRPLHVANTTYLRLDVPSVEEGAIVRLRNEGYWGVAVRAGETYDFSFFARPRAPARARLRVGLVAADGTLLARQDVVIDGTEWQRYAGSLTATASDGKAAFFLQPLDAGGLDLDFVSLFPRKTFKNRPNGLRADLGQLLADLQPAFLRFPGGCVVEGITMENRVQWKKTLGPLHERSGHWSMWGYRVTDGLGHHEFLQLCEDLGAKAMWVVNVGLSCEGRNGDAWSEERLPELIQDTLDGIEYAIGPVDSPWGRRRAEAGHPAPFPLEYIEIGAENHGPMYQRRYRQFAAAIKQAWPQLTLICNEKIDGIEVEDPHFYATPHFFFGAHRRYDAAPRAGAPRIYVGEFAGYENVGSGSLLAALSEASFTMGLERNGDLVTLSSYAPLFFNVHDPKWPVNMIGFDAGGSFGRTSYHGQRMLASNLAAVNVACTATSPALDLPYPSSSFGFGTWKTTAEFSDVRATAADGTTIFEADFSKDLGGFKALTPQWTAVDGGLQQTGEGKPARAVAKVPLPAAYTLQCKTKKISGEGFMISCDDGRHGKNWFVFGGWEPFPFVEIGGVTIRRVPGTIDDGRWYDVRIEMSGSRLRCSVDGKIVYDVPGPAPLTSLYAVAGRTNGGDLILKVVNAADRPQRTQISITGAATFGSTATLISMSHPDRTAENSLAEPTKVVPTEATIEVSPDFAHNFPANSISVLRVKTTGK
jgi:alpha-L-arabinofuranosidase